MVKHISLFFFLGVAWLQSADSLVVDESFYDNGNLKYQRFYKDGKADGRWTHNYGNGNIWFEGAYKNGIQVGFWTTYYNNGQEWTKGDYKNNERIGKWIFFNYYGTVRE
tara:strand:+ start:2539 stop:2865 length:327 start_codon:yes stop_codon:yes gene_type:complete